MANNINLYTGDLTFPDGKTSVFTNEKEFEELFYKLISSIIESKAMSIAYGKIQSLINIDYMIDNIEYELILPTNYIASGSYKPQVITLAGRIIHYNLETHKDYYSNELLKVKNHFINKTSNINLINLVENQFENSKIRIIGNNQETIFDDETVIKICRKIQTPYIRTLFDSPRSRMTELHEIAMDCYKRYGGHILTFLLKLPILKFATKNVSVLKAFVNNKGLIPAYRFKCGNSSCILKFNEKKKSDPNTFKSVVFLDARTRIEIGKVTFNGKISHGKGPSSQITLFRNNFNNGQLHCEVALGNCLNPSCNHPLTDPRSLIAGYGKTCAENLGIPY